MIIQNCQLLVSRANVVTNPVKEGKSGSFNHIPNNSHSWGKVVVRKGGGNITWEICQRHGTWGSIEQDFYLFHKDDILNASLLHPCKDAFLLKGVKLIFGVSYFVYHQIYDIANKSLW